MVKGKKVSLRPLKKGDESLFFAWRNDLGFIEMAQSMRFPKHELLEERWLENSMLDTSNKRVFFIVESELDHVPIGFSAITEIDWLNRNALVGFSIMDQHYQGKGLSHEGFTLTLDYAFNFLNLRKTVSLVLDKNEASKRMCFSATYELEGTLKDHFFWNNQYHDVLYLSAFREKFNLKFKKQ